MQNKGFVKVFAVLLTLVCVFYLSFSFVTRYHMDKAAQDPKGEGDHLTEKLAGSKNISERVNVFTTEYVKLRGKELADGIKKLENYLRERIYDTDGCISIRQLAEETGYSECYIRRVFQQVHGISPKNFERFVRFQKLLHVINKMPERIRLDALAQQCGYYDEAHMIKDFKQYAGITPQGYERLITGTKIPELEL